jgi:hypothetical protein
MRAWQVQYDSPAAYGSTRHAVVFAIDAKSALKKFTKKSKLSDRAVTKVEVVPSTFQIR